MAYDTFERSQYRGRPVELFTFRIQGRVLRYVRGAVGVNIGGEDFEPAQIQCTEIRDSSEREKNNVTLTFDYLLDQAAPVKPSTQPLGALWHPYVPSSPVFVVIQEIQADDPDQQLKNTWSGRAGQPKFGTTSMQLVCFPSRSQRKAWAGRSPRWQRPCPLAVYSEGVGMCNLDPDAWAVQLNVTGVSGLTMTAPEVERTDGIEWAGGMVEWIDQDGVVQSRTIRSSSGLDIRLDYGAAGLADVLEATAWPGCPGNWDACEKRENSDNYGGCLYMPGKSPFDGTRAV